MKAAVFLLGKILFPAEFADSRKSPLEHSDEAKLYRKNGRTNTIQRSSRNKRRSRPGTEKRKYQTVMLSSCITLNFWNKFIAVTTDTSRSSAIRSDRNFNGAYGNILLFEFLSLIL
ncbi:unnamed protein product [Nesidiocoris tenuis]|uniref:Uncharacterized protein n=1 Tax=Nesidiocoris tenuis TaxID=355587 RepID=A0A6H5GJS0_9HEMI|nr:unnamed protein product [Nesidiocoris tenuis]